MKKFSLIIVFSICSSLFGDLSVVIIGGGPAGLATAIEAKSRGVQVTVIEKREDRSREQALILEDASLQLLKKWNVAPKSLHIAEVGHGNQFGVVPIMLLEEALEEKAQELGITLLQAEFLHLKEGAVEILMDNEVAALPYDLLVAADGVHSRVREELGIEAKCMGKAMGAAIAFRTHGDGKMGITDAIVSGAYFARKISMPSFSLFFIQSFALEPISHKDLELAARDGGFREEADLIAQEKARFFDNIPVCLQQAVDFSNPKAKAIVVGDAAACASFYQGMGANTALKTAVLAGELTQKLQACEENAYETFNQKMKETTDELIEGSRFLFFPEQI